MKIRKTKSNPSVADESKVFVYEESRHTPIGSVFAQASRIVQITTVTKDGEIVKYERLER